VTVHDSTLGVVQIFGPGTRLEVLDHGWRPVRGKHTRTDASGREAKTSSPSCDVKKCLTRPESY
jgi:hypothetical protein